MLFLVSFELIATIAIIFTRFGSSNAISKSIDWSNNGAYVADETGFVIEIKNLDLSARYDNETLGKLKSVVMNYGVAILRGQEKLDTHKFRYIGQNFGDLQIHQESYSWHPDYSDVNIVSNMKNASTGKFIGLHGGDVELFHSDLAWAESPTSFTLLKGEITSENEGMTLFSDSAAAYETLPSAIQSLLENQMAEYSYTKHHKLSCSGGNGSCTESFPVAFHSVISVHPVTGRRSIYASTADTTRILGMEPAESSEVLQTLENMIADTRFHYAHQWRVGDVVIWDNRLTQHRSGGCPMEIPRKLVRVTAR